jgi:hypothetical protein
VSENVREQTVLGLRLRRWTDDGQGRHGWQPFDAEAKRSVGGEEQEPMVELALGGELRGQRIAIPYDVMTALAKLVVER